MIPTLAVAVLLSPQVPEGQWGPTTMNPVALASKVDGRLANLRNAKLQYEYTYRKKAVGQGFVDCFGTIVKPGEFRLEIPNVNPKRVNVLEKEIWIADGKRFGAVMGSPFPKPGAMSLRPGVPSRPLSVWFSDFSRVLLSGVGQPTRPLQSLLTDAKRQGYRVSAGVRKLHLLSGLNTSYRLVLSKGPARYEIVIDGKFLLPTSVTNTIGSSDDTRWSAVRWSFPRLGVDASEARFKVVATKKAPAPKPRRS